MCSDVLFLETLVLEGYFLSTNGGVGEALNIGWDAQWYQWSDWQLKNDPMSTYSMGTFPLAPKQFHKKNHMNIRE